MNVYSVPFIVLVIFSFKDILLSKNKRITNKIVISSILLYLIIIAGFRDGMGKDYYTYKSIFMEINNFTDHSYLEPGFRLLVLGIKMFTSNVNYIFLVFSFITLYPLKKVFMRNSEYPTMSLLVYLSLFYTAYVFNGMRQAVAMTVFLCSIDAIQRKDIKKVLLWTVLAMSFHSSGIIIFISFVIRNIKVKLSKQKLYAITLILLLFYFNNQSLLGFILSIAPPFLRSKLIIYTQFGGSGITVVGLFQRLFILVILFSNLNKSNNSQIFKEILPIYYIGFVTYILFSFQEIFSTRINMFFRVLEVFLTPSLFLNNTKVFYKFLLFIIIITWLGSVYFSIIGDPFYYPFKSII